MSDTPPTDAREEREPHESGESTLSWGDLGMALGTLALGVFFLVGGLNIRVTSSYDQIGPRFFPFLVAGGLLLCGALLLVQALRGAAAPLEEAEDVDVHARANWLALVILSAALLLDILLIERIGFVLGSLVLFWGVAFGFGSRAYVRDVLTGLALSLTVYLAFTRLLDLNLPAGILPL